MLYSGSDGTLAQLAYDMATAKGFNMPFENVAMFGSHTHSGPGAITPEMLWEFAPATDLIVPGVGSFSTLAVKHLMSFLHSELQTMLAASIAEAMIQAAANLQEASIGISKFLSTLDHSQLYARSLRPGVW